MDRARALSVDDTAAGPRISSTTTRKDEIDMGKTIMGAVVSLDGFIADDNDRVGPLFDWYRNGEIAWSFPGGDDEFNTTRASAEFTHSYYRDVAAVVIGRRLFDLTNGWNFALTSPGSMRPTQCEPRVCGRLVRSDCRLALDLSHRRGVDDQIPEGSDRGHIDGSEEPIWLDQDGHLAAVSTRPIGNPAEVHDSMHGAVGYLRGELVLNQVQRGEWERVEVGAWCVQQVFRQTLAQRRHSLSKPGLRLIPPEQLADFPADRPQRARKPGALRGIAGGETLHQRGEVALLTMRGQRPHVLEPKVGGDLMDAPRTRGVRAVRKSRLSLHDAGSFDHCARIALRTRASAA